MRTIAYDVIGVNVFLPTLMRILPKKGDNFIPPILLLSDFRVKKILHRVDSLICIPKK